METVYSLNLDLFFKTFSLAGQNSFLDSLMVLGANYSIFLVGVLNIYFLIKHDNSHKKAFILGALSMVIGFSFIYLLRLFWHEPRPFVSHLITPMSVLHISAYSFPSVHTFVMTVITFSNLIYRAKFAYLMIFLLIFSGFARVYVGVHYPWDILGGLIIGILSVIVGYRLKSWLEKKK